MTDPATRTGSRCGDRRRRVRRPVHAAPAARARASRRACSRPAAASAAPGTGTAIPGARCDVESMRVLLPVLRRAAAGVGLDASATPPSPRSCATPTTSPTGSTCAATSSFDTRVTPAALRRGRGRAGRSRPSDGDRVVGARFCIMATGCLSSPQHCPTFPGLDELRGRRATTPATGRTRASTSRGKRVGVIGTGSSAIQSIPIIAEQADAADRVPAHAQLHRARAQRAARRRTTCARSRPTTPSLRAARQADARPASTSTTASSRRCETPPRSARASTSARWAARRPRLPRRLQRPDDRPGRPTTPPPSSCAPRSARRCAIPAVAELLSPTQHHRLQAAVRRHRLLRDLQPRQRDAGRRAARRRSRRITPTGVAGRRRASTRSTPSCSPPASTP